jgi:large subunit ribosomal protein L5
MTRLQEIYNKEIRPNLMKEFGMKNIYEVPKLKKIVLNMGLGADLVKDKKKIDSAIDDLKLISGQMPIITKSKKAIANFKIKENMPIGCKVTIRKNRMYEFVDRLINIALPRAKDFQGLSSKSFDGEGNYTFGIKEHIIFPEIDYDKVDKIRGMDITIVTSAIKDDHARSLLKGFNFPLKE